MIFTILPGVYGLVHCLAWWLGCLIVVWGDWFGLYSAWFVGAVGMFGCWWVFLLLLLVVVGMLVINAVGLLLIVLLTSLFYSFGVVVICLIDVLRWLLC